MVLVELAHGKTKHVPYRDSRLTFLLQVHTNPVSSASISSTFLGPDAMSGTKYNAGFSWWELKNNDHCQCQPFYLVGSFYHMFGNYILSFEHLKNEK